MKFEEFLDNVFAHGSLTAIIELDGSTVTYSKLEKLFHEWVSRFEGNGFAPATKVVIVGDFNSESISILFALFHLRCIVIPVSLSGDTELKTMMAVTGCDFVIDLRSDNAVERLTPAVDVGNPLYAQLEIEDAAGLVLFSSGSSGVPKGILHSVNRLVSRFRIPPKPVVAVPMLMFDHFGGFNTVFGMLMAGSTIVRVKSRTVDDVCEAIQKHAVSLLPTTPSFLALMLLRNAQNEYNLASLKKISYGTEPMSDELLHRVHGAFPGVQLQQTYGLSEVGVLASRSRDSGSTQVEIGGKGFETKVVDGKLWVKSEFAMLGYLNGNGEEFVDGWFDTQDRVEVVDGAMRILGRDTEMINVAGQKVLPIEVEEILLMMPAVEQANVYAESHPMLGQVVSAEIVLSRTGKASAVTRTDIQRFCRERLANFKCPQRIKFVDEIFVSTRGKRVKK